MKKFEITFDSGKNQQGWLGSNSPQKFELLRCIFYAENIEEAESFKEVVKKNYKLPNGILGLEFILKEIE